MSEGLDPNWVAVRQREDFLPKIMGDIAGEEDDDVLMLLTRLPCNNAFIVSNCSPRTGAFSSHDWLRRIRLVVVCLDDEDDGGDIVLFSTHRQLLPPLAAAAAAAAPPPVFSSSFTKSP